MLGTITYLSVKQNDIAGKEESATVRKLPRKLSSFLFALIVVLPILLLMGHFRLHPQANWFRLVDKAHRFNNATLLTAGQSVRQQLAVGENRLYRIVLDSGQYFRVILSRTGLNLSSVALYGPDGKILTELDCLRSQPTPMSLITEASGTYLLEVRSPKGQVAAGHYEICISDIRQAKPNDNYRIVAERASVEGEQLRVVGSVESQRKAIKKYGDALAAFQAANAKQETTNTLKNIGEIYHLLGEPQTSLKYYEQALLLNQELNSQREEGETLNSIGYIYLSLGENHKAMEYCTRALKLSIATANRRGEAQALNDTGETYYAFGNLQQSLIFYQQAMYLWCDLASNRGQAQTLLNFGYTYADLGEPQKAFDFYKQALSLWQSSNDYRGQALTLTALGRLNSRLGESQEALSYFNQAMSLAQMIGDQIEQARIFNGIGYIHEGLGQKQNALEYYDQALALFRAVRYRNGEATTLHEMGRAYYSIGDNWKALDYFQRALSISQAIADQRLTSYSLRGIGMAYDSGGYKTKALKYYNRALPSDRAGKDRRGEAFTLNLVGRIYHGWRQQQKALGYYQRALQLNQAAGDRIRESLTFYNIACVERDLGHQNQALIQIEAALRIVESLRNKVASRDLRTSYFASIQQYYELDIDLLMRQSPRAAASDSAAALEASERARVRSLLDLLTEAHADIRQDADPALIQRARTLQKEINARAERKTRLLNAKAQSNEMVTIAKEVATLTAERDQVEGQIRLKSPRYASLTQPRPISRSEIQGLLDEDTLLLEYSLGSERSYLWVVTPNSLKGYELPGRAKIEKRARALYELLAPSDSTPARPEKRRDDEYLRQATALSEMILKPVAAELGHKRLLIVADGVLQYIPFSALPTPRKGRQGNGQARNSQFVPLIVEHEIVNLPSASALAVLRRETSGRQLAPKAVAVIADPVFETDDMRVLTATGKIKSPGPANQVAASLPLLRGRRGGNFARLPATQNEARAIEEFTSPADRLIAKGFDANRAQAISSALSQYRIIHFATHGILDRDNPELSAIVLSLVDRQGNTQDGYLRLHDIYNLNLPAELVVLSACDSGLGKEFKGEGLVGLTRGFMYAGALRVMASLWKVEDEPTAKLMKLFYQGMLKDKLSAAAALRRAQIALWQDAQWHAPYFWAAFTLQGEWK